MWKKSEAACAILLITILAIKGAKGQGYNEQPYTIEEQSTPNFKEIGIVSSNIQRAVIYLEIPHNQIQESYLRAELACQKVTEVMTDKKYAEFHASLKAQADFCQSTMVRMKTRSDELFNFFLRKYYLSKREQKRRRRKRFISAAILVGLGALGAYSISQLLSMKTSYNLEQNQHQIYEVIRNQDQRLSNIEERLEVYNDTLQELAYENRHYQQLSDLQDFLERISLLVAIELNEYERITDALLQLTTSRVSASLLSSKVLYRALKNLDKKARAQGWMMPLVRIEEVFELPHDYLWHNSSLSLFLYVPLVQDNTAMKLLKLEPYAIQLTDLHSAVIDEPHYLAVSQDMASFKIITPEELALCIKIKSYYFCDSNVVLMSHEEYCIAAVFKGRSQAATSTCTMYLVPQKNWAKQLTPQSFVVYHQKETDLTIQCNQERYVEKVQGIRRLNLQGCEVTCNFYKILSHKNISETEAIVEYPAMNWKPEDWKLDLSNSELDAIVEDLKSTRPVAVADVANRARLRPVARIYWHLPNALLSFCVIVFLILIGCLVWKRYKAHQKGVKRRANKQAAETERQDRRPMIVRFNPRSTTETTRSSVSLPDDTTEL